MMARSDSQVRGVWEELHSTERIGCTTNKKKQKHGRGEQAAAAVAALGESGFFPEPHRGELPVATCGPKHSPKSGPLGEDFRLLAESCQASWDL